MSARKAILISAVPALALAIFIAAFGTNVPFWDEWGLAGVIERLALHQATVAHFLEPQSEHRFVSAKVILAPLALATHWNVIVELWLSFVVAVIGYIGLLRLLRDAGAMRIAITSLAWFSLAAYENWLWGWQFSWFLTNTLFVWAVVAAANRRIASAAILCFVATFSAAYGVVSWIAIAPFFRRRALAAWLTLFAGALALYLYRFHPTPGGSPARSPLAWIAYVFAVLGSPLTRVGAIAAFLGVVLVTMLLKAPRQPWFSIGLFAIGFALINAIGRSGLGMSQALTSRYLTPASLLLIAVINLHEMKRLVQIGIAAALIAQSLSSIPIGWQIKRSRDEARVCLGLLLVNDSPDCTAPLAASNAALRSAATAMHRIGLRPLVTEADFVTTPAPAARGLFVVAATIAGERRIVAAKLRGAPEIPPHITAKHAAFDMWIYLPERGKLYPNPNPNPIQSK